MLAISDEIPNDTMSFGADFPLNLARQIADAVAAYVSSDACLESATSLCSDDFYTWTGAAEATDAMFDPTRFIIEALGMTEEDVLGE